MRRGHFSLSDLPAWCVLNDVTFVHVKSADINDRGYGLVAEKSLADEDGSSDIPALLTIPRDLVLSAEGVEEYAKENKDFRQLLDTAGRRSTRGDVLLFLLVQLVLSSPDYKGGQGPSTPWTHYFSLLPSYVPTPTMWTESELFHLKGTSLESAVSAKLTTLTKEFDDLRTKTASLPFWDEIFSIDESITIQDWILLDALYRSRSLGLPQSGEAMVPCLDLVNHSSKANAYFDENRNGDVVLRLHNGCNVSSNDEITIDYGKDKSPAEMLFSYGFIDPDSTISSLVLPLDPLNDDPLATAKLHAFGTSPKLRLAEDENGIPHWTAPFVYLMCLNEEDGLHFRVLQETDGSRHLKMFWQDIDITHEPDGIIDHIRGHELYPIFELRVITVLLGIFQEQLEQLSDKKDGGMTPGSTREEIWLAVSRLKSLEMGILKKCLVLLEEEKTRLLEDDKVLEYLNSMMSDQDDIAAGTASDEEDFS
ncbi:SET domain-containing protein [Annulohypoxylon maeteangense]|uniref:SET domain-containing protein n=1 Tax=Annulohypoxylon maeteangense TaxID=1927788 RepID=UPI002008C412|nr:SET domain-containing protein [Annulohypoxylon maeteangense]KAI0885583.1 SET domain-containing protein [Annulohypoxylon maeteangense]